MLKIRLRRAGKRHQPTYRVVVVEHTAPAQGSYLEAVGLYNPRAHEFSVKEDRVLHWLNNGAQPSERIAKLLTSTGVKHKLIVLPDYSRKPKKTTKNPAPEAAAPKAEEKPAEVTAEATTEEVASDAVTEETPTETAEETSTETTSETPAAEEAPSAEPTEPTEGGSNPEADAAVPAEETPAEEQE